MLAMQLMSHDEIRALLKSFNDNCIDASLKGKTFFDLGFLEDDYLIIDLHTDEFVFKFFSFDELIGYDRTRLIQWPPNAPQTEIERMLSIPLSERDVYSGWELLDALSDYIKYADPSNADLENPLFLCFYLLDKRTDVSSLDEKNISHKWLADIYHLRLTGRMPEEFYERKTVVLDFAACNTPDEIEREMQIKMKFFLYYGIGLDALWDILTGMDYYGDDFIIKRKKIYTYTAYGKVFDFSEDIDKICKLFNKAAESIYADISVKIEYVE